MASLVTELKRDPNRSNYSDKWCATDPMVPIYLTFYLSYPVMVNQPTILEFEAKQPPSNRKENITKGFNIM